MDAYAIVVTGRGNNNPIQNGSVLPGVPLDARVSGVMIPEVHIKQASFSASLELLRQRVAEFTGGAAAVNFVVQNQEEFEARPINLELSDVPFFAALRYVCYQADAKFAVDRYAIIVSPVNTNESATQSASK